MQIIPDNFILILVRNILAMFALFSFLAGLVIFVTSVMLIVALRKVIYILIFKFYRNNRSIDIKLNKFQEYEDKIVPWLWSFAVFTVLRGLSWIFFSIVNDLIFAYNLLMCLSWALLIVLSVWSWLVVYSLYLELKSLSKLEDLAQLRVSINK